jgi:hypothetical protein
MSCWSEHFQAGPDEHPPHHPLVLAGMRRDSALVRPARPLRKATIPTRSCSPSRPTTSGRQLPGRGRHYPTR